jgi:hypothetical protein
MRGAREHCRSARQGIGLDCRERATPAAAVGAIDVSLRADSIRQNADLHRAANTAIPAKLARNLAQ